VNSTSSTLPVPEGGSGNEKEKISPLSWMYILVSGSRGVVSKNLKSDSSLPLDSSGLLDGTNEINGRGVSGER
jgi:hypothetical protein